MTQWLTPEEQYHWRAFLSVLSLLPHEFSRDLQCAQDLTLADYEILVRLSEGKNRSVRMSDLAARTLASKSRLTHQIDRMVNEGLVERVPCDDDKRGYWAVMTDKGWERLKAAAPSHVDSVRKHLVDVLTPSEFETLGEISRKLLAALDPETQMKSVIDVSGRVTP